jgi:hypothetical protein
MRTTVVTLVVCIFLTDAKIFSIWPTLHAIGNNVCTKTQKLHENEGKIMGMEKRARELLLREARLPQGEQREQLRAIPTRGIENSTHRDSRDLSGNSNNNRGGGGGVSGEASPGGRQTRPAEYPQGDYERTKVSDVVN